MRQFSYTNPFLASNIKEEKTKLKSGDEPSLFPKGSRKKRGGGKGQAIKEKELFFTFLLYFVAKLQWPAWGGGVMP